MSSNVFIELSLYIPPGALNTTFAILIPVAAFSGTISWGDGTTTTYTNANNIGKTYTRNTQEKTEEQIVYIQFINVTSLTSIQIGNTPSGSTLNYRNNLVTFFYLINIPSFTNFNSLFNGCPMFTNLFIASTYGHYGGIRSTQEQFDNQFTRTANVTSMTNMFRNATSFTEIFGDLNTSNVTSMASMFQGATSFFQPVYFDTSKVTSMSSMFQGATSFNQEVNFNTQNVTIMTSMFQGATSFNQQVNFNTQNVTNMASMFQGATSFNQLVNFNTSKVTGMSSMFEGATSFTSQFISNGGTLINNATNIFPANYSITYIELILRLPATNYTIQLPLSTFIGRINWGDGTSITSTSNTFTNTATNCTKTYIGTGSVRDIVIRLENVIVLSNMSISTTAGENILNYRNALIYFGYQNQIPTFTNFSRLFAGVPNNISFDMWDSNNSSNVTTMEGMFQGATSFNNVVQLVTSNVTNMASMFQNATSFNQSVNFDTSNVTTMASMFQGATSFDQEVNYDTSKVTTMASMFQGATSFDQNLNFDLQKVTTIANMLNGATTFKRIYNFSNRNSITTITDAFKNVASRRYIDTGYCIEIVLDITPLSVKTNNVVTSFSTIALPTNGFLGVVNWGDDTFTEVQTSTEVQKTYTVKPNEDFIRVIRLYDIYRLTAWITDTQSLVVRYASCVKIFKYFDKIPSFKNFNYLFNKHINLEIVECGEHFTSIVTNMSYMFANTNKFNQDIGWLDTGSVTNMRYMFFNAKAFNQPVGFLNTRLVTNMSYMFSKAEKFNQPINELIVTNVTDMQGMFQDAISFNTPINLQTDALTNISHMFSGSSNAINMSFNSLITFSNTENLTNVAALFKHNKAFNNYINKPSDVDQFTLVIPKVSGNVISTNNINGSGLSSMFEGATSFNKPVNIIIYDPTKTLSTNPAITLARMFCDAQSFNSSFNIPDVRNVTEMRRMFSGAKEFNQPFSEAFQSSSSKVTDMSYMFMDALKFNQPINFNTASLTTTSYMFARTSTNNTDLMSFNSTFGTRFLDNLSKLTNVSYMFNNNSTFNRPITFNLSGVVSSINLTSMFESATAFNSNVYLILPTSTNTALNVNCTTMFKFATRFGFSSSTVSAGTLRIDNSIRINNMANMFEGASNFNNPFTGVNALNTSRVTNMTYMFDNAVSFNQEVNFDTSLVTNFIRMFNNANSFNQAVYFNINSARTDIHSEGIGGLAKIFNGTSIGMNNYARILNHFVTTSTKTGIQVGVSGLKYNNVAESPTIPSGQTSINTLTSRGWSFPGHSFTTKAESTLIIQGPAYVDKLSTDAPFSISVTSNNLSQVSYSSSDTSVAIINTSGTITIMGSGLTTITVLIPENLNQTSVQRSITLEVKKVSSNISLTNIVDSTVIKSITDNTFQVNATSNTNELPIKYMVVPNPDIVEVDENGDPTGVIISVPNNVTISGNGLITFLEEGFSYIKVYQEATTYSKYDGNEKIFVIYVKKPVVFTLDSDYNIVYNQTKSPSNITTNSFYKLLSNSNGTFTYNSSNPLAVTINSENGLIRGVGLGTSIITVIQQTTTSYLEGQTTFTVNVSKSPAVLSISGNNTSITKTFGESDFSLFSQITLLDTNINNGNNDYIFTSDNTNIVTIDQTTGEIHINEAGSTIILCQIIETTNYFATNVVSIPISISKASSQVSITNTTLTNTFGENSFNLQDRIIITSLNPNPFNFISNNNAVATIDPVSGLVTITGAGNVTFTVSQDTSLNYLDNSNTIRLTINQANSVISSVESLTRQFGNNSFNLQSEAQLTSPNPNSFSYTSDNIEVATIHPVSGLVNINGVGTATFTVSQLESDNYFAPPNKLITINVTRGNTVISVANQIEKTFGDLTFNLGATSNQNDRSLTYISSDPSIAFINNNSGQVNILSAGDVIFTVSQEQSPNYSGTSIDVRLKINRATPVINIVNPGSKKFLDPAFNLVASSSHNESTLSYYSNNSNVATIGETSGQVNILQAGTVIFTVTQAESNNYSLQSNTITLNISRINSVITVSQPTSKTFGEPTFKLNASLNHTETTLTYSSSDHNIAMIGENSGEVTILGAGGPVTFTISNLQTTNYFAGSNSVTLTIDKATPVINITNPGSKTFGEPNFNLVAISHNETALTYSSNNPSVASINSSTGEVTILKAGTVNFSISQSESPNYFPTTIPTTFTLNINRKMPTITVEPVILKVFGDPSFNLNASLNHNESTLTYTTSNSNIATIGETSGQVTIVNTGTVSFRVSQAQSENYLATYVDVILNINQPTMFITVSDPTPKTFGDPSFNLNATSSNTETALSYSSSDTTKASINSSTGQVTILQAGSVSLTVSQGASTNYPADSKTVILTINRATPVITVSNPTARTFGDPSFNLGATSTNTQTALSYSSSDNTKASINSSTGEVTILQAGSVDFTVSQAESTNYFAATSVTVSLTINRATPVITVSNPTARTFGNAAFNLGATSTNTQTALSYSSSDTTKASINSSTGQVTILQAGSVDFTVSQAESTNYFAATSVTVSLTINRATTTITSIGNQIKKFGDPDFNVNAASNNPESSFIYSSAQTGRASIDNNGLVKILNAGSVFNLTISQGQSTNYLAATRTITLTINRATTTLTSIANQTKKFGDPPFNLNASSIGGNTNTITYSSAQNLRASVNTSGMVTILNTGATGAQTSTTFNLTISQAATTNWTQATRTVSLTISKATPVITVSTPPTKKFGDPSFNLNATSNHNVSSLTYSSSQPSIASINSSTGQVTILQPGNVTFTISQAATPNYLAATSTVSLTINMADPVITVSTPPTKKFGDPSFNLNATSNHNESSLTYSSSQPSIASINSSTGQVTILQAGNVTFTISQAATTNYFAASSTVSLTINSVAPVITIENPPTTKFGDPSFNLNATSNHNESELIYSSSEPSIASINSSTGQVTILQAGDVIFTVSQPTTTNYLAAVESINFTINRISPIITIVNPGSKTFGDPNFNLNATSNHNESGLIYSSSEPSIASINSSTGEVTIQQAGTVIFTISQADSTNYLYGSESIILNINRATSDIKTVSALTKLFGDEDFMIDITEFNSETLLKYASLDTNKAVINDYGYVTILGAGRVILRVSQDTSTNYLATFTDIELTINKAEPIINIVNPGSKTFGDPDFNVIADSSHSESSLTYSSSDNTIATIGTNDGRVKILKVGTVTFTVSQSVSDNYLAGSEDITITISQATPVINIVDPGSKTFGDPEFNLVATSHNESSLTYSSSDDNVATIGANDGRVKILNVGTGTVTFTVSQSASYNYIAASKDITITINKATPVISAVSQIIKEFGDDPFNVNASSHNESSLTYSSSDDTVATIGLNNGLVEILKVGNGTVTFTVSQTASNNYLAASKDITLTINKATPVIHITNPGSKTFGDPEFNLVASSSHNESSLTYSSYDESVATIGTNNGLVKILKVGTGTVTFTVSQSGSDNYLAASKDITVTLNKATPVINITNPGPKTFGDPEFNLVATSHNESSLTYSSSSDSVATIGTNNGRVKILNVGTGTVTFTVSQSVSDNYIAASKDITVTLNKATSVINITNPGPKTFGDPEFNLVASSSHSESSLTYSSSNNTVATIDTNDGRVKILKVGTGTVTFTVSQSVSDNYIAASKDITITLNKATPVINITNPGSKTFGDPEFNLVATSSHNESSLTYASSNNTAATIGINNGLVKILNVGTGTVTFTVSQSVSDNYLAASKDITVTLNKATSVINITNPGPKTFGDPDFNLVASSSHSESSLTYSSSNNTAATIGTNNGLVKILNVVTGTVTFTVSQSVSDNYLAASKDITVTLNKAAPVINITNPGPKTFGDPEFNLVATSSHNESLLTYASSNSTVATIGTNNGIVKILKVGTGTVTFTVSQSGSDNYLAASKDITVTLNKATPVINITNPGSKTFGDPEFNLVATSSHNESSLTYASSSDSVATIGTNNGRVKILNVVTGTVTFTVSQSVSDNYLAASKDITVTLNKATPVINITNPGSKTFGDPEFNLVASSSHSESSLTYSSSNSSVATIGINNGLVKILNVGTGTVTFTVSQSASDNYLAASKDITITINKATPVISAVSQIIKEFGDEPFNVNASSHNESSLTYSSSDATVATIGTNNGLVEILKVGTGTVTFTVSQSASNNYLAASKDITLNINKATPTINIVNPGSKTFGDPDFNLVATSSHNESSLTYSSSDDTVATIGTNNGLVKILKVGTGNVTFTVSQSASDNYIAASKQITLNINKATPVINIVNPGSKTFGEPEFNLVATSHNESSLTYASSNSTVATIGTNNGRVKILKVGTGTITFTVSQSGSDNYLAASKDITIILNKATPVINITNPGPKTFGDPEFNLVASSSHNESSLTYASSDDTVATIGTNNGLVKILKVGTGTVTFTVSQSGSDNYLAASKDITISISKATPVINITNPGTKTFGDPEFNLVATSSHNESSLTYASSDDTIASINTFGVVKILKVGTGTVTFTVSQSVSDNYLAASKDITVTLNKATPVINITNPGSKTFGDPEFNLVASSSHSESSLTYSSSNNTIATIGTNNGRVKILNVGTGTVTFTVSQSISDNYLAASKDITVTLNKATPVINITNPGSKTFGDPEFNLVASSSHSESSLTYSSSDDTVATIGTNNGLVNILKVGTGTVTFTVSQSVSDNYIAASKDITVTLNKATPVINITNPGSKTFGDPEFNLVATSSHNESLLTYASSNSTAATIGTNNGLVKILNVGTGTVTFTVSQSVSDNYLAASKDITVTLNKATPVINITNPGSKTFGDPEFNLVATSSHSESSLTYYSSNNTAATIGINNGRVKILNVVTGTVTFTVSQSVSDNYLAASKDITVILNKATPVINITNPGSKTFGDPEFNLVATSSHNESSLTYASSNSTVATIGTNNGVVKILQVGTGTVTFTVSQTVSDNYIAASKDITVTLNKATPVINITNPGSKTFGDPEFNLVATSSHNESSLTYASSSDSTATIGINNGLVKILNVGTGTVTFTVSQSVSDNYLAASKDITVSINKATPVIAGETSLTKTFGDDPFNVNASSHNESSLTYSSSDDTIATIGTNNGLVNILKVGTGTVTFTVSQSASGNYIAASKDIILNINKAAPVINITNPGPKTFGDPEFNLVATSSHNESSLTYASSSDSTATIGINNGLVKILNVGTGTVTFTVSQSISDNYLAASKDITVILNKATPVINITNPGPKTFGDPEFNLVATSHNESLLTYSSSDDTVATIGTNDGLVNILKVGTGTVTFTVSQSVSNNYLAASKDITVTLNKAAPVINITNPGPKTFGDPEFNLVATSSHSESSLTYSSSDDTVATIGTNNGLVKILKVGTGTVTFTVSQSGSDNYLAASKDITVTLNKATPVINITNPGSKTFGDPGFNLVASSSHSESSLTYSSSDDTVATIGLNNGLVEILKVGTGTVTFTVSQSVSDNYLAASKDITVTLNKATPVINITNPGSKTFGDPEFNLVASSSHNESSLTYASSNSSVSTIGTNNGLVKILKVGTGTVTFTVSQTVSDNYLAASKDITITINKATPVINITNPGPKTFGDPEFNLVATSHNESSLTYTSSSDSVATIGTNNGLVKILNVGTGTVTFTVSQSVSDNYLAASKDITVTLNKATPVINITNPGSKTFGDLDFNLVATSSHNESSLTYASSNNTAATIGTNNGLVKILNVGTGTVTFTVSQSVSDNYIAASKDITVTLNKATPIINVVEPGSKTFGDPDFDLVASSSHNESSLTYASSNSTVATIDTNDGRVKILKVGTGTVTFTVSQSVSDNYLAASKDITVTLNKATPVINITNPGPKTFGDPEFNLVATSHNESSLTYASSNSSVATIGTNNGLVKILNVGTGTVTFTVSQPGSDNYLSGENSITLQIEKATPVINTETSLTKTFGDPDFYLVASSSNTEKDLIYDSSNTALATVDRNNGLVKILRAGGPVTFIVSQPASDNYLPVFKYIYLNINQANSVINIVDPGSKTFGDPDFNLVASSSHNESDIMYTSLTTSIATIGATDGRIKILKAGTATFKVSQEETINYPSYYKTINVIINQATPVINITNPGSKTFGDPEFNLVATSSHNESSLTYSSSDESVATIDTNNGIVKILKVGTGTVTFTVSQSVSDNYLAASKDITVTLNKATPVINITNPGSKTFGDPEFNLVATSHNESSLTYSSYDESVATIGTNNGRVKILKVGTGTVTFTVSQSVSDNYIAASKDITVTLNKATPVINITNPGSKTFGDLDFNLVATSSHNESSLTYASSNNTAATIGTNNGLVKILNVGTGTVTFTVSQSVSDNYLAASKEITVTLNKATPVIHITNPGSKTFGDPEFNLVATSHNESSLTYSSSDDTVATIGTNNGLVKILKVGTGTVTFTVSQTVSDNYLAASKDITVTLNKATPVINITNPGSKTFGDPEFNLVATSHNESSLTYASSNSSVATIGTNNGLVKILNVGTGTVTFTVSQSVSDNYLAASKDITVILNKATPVINITNPGPKTFGDPEFNLVATSHNESSLTYASSNTTAATIGINNGLVKILNVVTGTVTFTVSQSASDNYIAASKDITVTLNKATSVINITNPGPKTFGDPEFNLVATSSHNESSLTYASSSDSVATIGINNGLVKIINVGTGSVTFTVSQSASDNYIAASKDITVTLNKATSVINITNPGSKTFGDPEFNLVATSSHNESSLTYASSSDSTATIGTNNGLVNILKVGTGTVTFTVSQSVSDNYLAASKDITVSINKATPIINVVEPGSKTFGDLDFNVNATSSHNESSLTYSSSDDTVATIGTNNGLVKILKSGGPITFTVSQPGSDNYLAASKDIRLTINKATPTINIVNPGSKTFGDPDFNLVATSSHSESALTYYSYDESVATIGTNNGVVKILNVRTGTVTFTVSQSGSDNYLAASKDITVTLNKSIPVINIVNPGSKTFGDPEFNLVATSHNESSLTYASSDDTVATIGINNGLVKIINVGTGSVTFTVSQSASDNYIAASKDITVTLNKATSVINITNPGPKTFGDPEFNLVATSSHNESSLTYASSSDSVATIGINNGLVKIINVGTGSVTFTVSQSASDNYIAASKDITVTLNKATSVINITNPGSKTFGDPEFNLVATSSHNESSLTYASN